jgi:hypothetical protein
MPDIPWMIDNEARARKWALLTGYKDSKHPGPIHEQHGVFARIGVEMMLENQVALMTQMPALSHVGTRLPSMPVPQLLEAIDTSAVAPFVKASLPLITRLYVPLYAQSLCTVWPTPLPTAKIFWLNFNYGSSKFPASPGLRLDPLANHDRNFAGWGESPESFVGDGATTTFTVETAQIKTAAAQGPYGYSSPRAFVDGVEKTLGTDFTCDNGGANSRGRFIFGVAPALGTQIEVRYSTYQEGDTPRDIDMNMETDDLRVTDMVLRSGWTEQIRQDFAAWHGLNVEDQLTAAISGELYREIDWQLIQMMLTSAARQGAGNVNWSSTGYLPGDVDSTTRRSYEATLGDRISEASDLIWAATKGNARATWMICGTQTAQRLRKINSFRAFTGSESPGPNNTAADNMATLERRIPIGTVDGSRVVYMDPRFPSNKILMGYKSDNPMHMCAVYAPYNMLVWTPALPDPSANFKVKKGVLSRAAKRVVNPFALATLTIT